MRLVAVLVLVAAFVDIRHRAMPHRSKNCSSSSACSEPGRPIASRPATPANPHVSITTPSAGLVLEDHDLGPDFAVNRYSVLSAERISPSSCRSM